MCYTTVIMRESSNVYQQHGQINKLFPDQRALFHSDGKMIRVISKQPIAHATYRSKKVDLDKYQVGDSFMFSTRVNPIKTNIKTRKVEALHGAEAELFILKRFAQAGIRVISNTITYEGSIVVDKPNNPIRFSTYHVCGILEVVDVNKFTKTLTDGFVGRGKAFGYNTLNIIE